MDFNKRHFRQGRRDVSEVVCLDQNGTEALAEWVGSRIPHVGGANFGPCQGLAVADGDRILAGIVYHDYQKDYDSIQLSMAADSPMWARRENIAALLDYPFNQLECHRLFTLTPIGNIIALRTNLHIGFQREAVCHSAFGKNRHGVIMRMLQPDYSKLYERK